MEHWFLLFAAIVPDVAGNAWMKLFRRGEQ